MFLKVSKMAARSPSSIASNAATISSGLDSFGSDALNRSTMSRSGSAGSDGLAVVGEHSQCAGSHLHSQSPLRSRPGADADLACRHADRLSLALASYRQHSHGRREVDPWT